MSQYRECRLGDVLTLQRGFDLPAAQRSLGSVPVVSSSGVTGFHSEAKVRGPGVVIGRYGTLGEVHFMQEDFWPLNTSLYVKDFRGNDVRFCSYLLRTVSVVGTSAAAAVPGVNRNVLHEMPVRCPPLTEQRRIASILGAYDDLIEVNRRRIALLEEMVRRLFEEWFVHFRVPGRTDQPLMPGELGPIPQDWRVARLGDVYKTASGGPPSRKCPHFFGGHIPWVKTGELLDGPIFTTDECITEEGLAASSAKIFPRFTVLVAMYGANIGQLGVLANPAATNQACCAVIPPEDGSAGWAYVYLALHRERHRLIGLRAGAAQQNISQATIKSFPVLAPPTPLLHRFEATVSPFLLQAFLLYQQSANLAASRDLLLPRLISGDLSIAAAERELESAA